MSKVSIAVCTVHGVQLSVYSCVSISTCIKVLSPLLEKLLGDVSSGTGKIVHL